MIKRDGKLFLRCLLSASVMLVILAVLCVLSIFITAKISGSVYTPVNVAVVDSEDSVISRILVHTIENIDYVSGLLKTETMSPDEAWEALRLGKCSAVVVLPEGYVDDILSGRASQGKIVISGELSSQREIVESIADFGELMLVSGQCAVFSGERLIGEHKLGSAVRSDFLDKVNPMLLSEALTAGDRFFTVEVTDFCDTGMAAAPFYSICWIIMFLFLLSVFFITLFRRDCTVHLLRRLRTLGVGSVRFLAPKLLMTLSLRAILLAAALSALYAAGIAEFSLAALPCAAAAAVYITLVGACLSMCFGNGVVSCLIVSAGGLFMCGGLVPRQLLPRVLTSLGDYTPFGAAKALLAPAFGAPFDIFGVIMAVLYAALAVILMCRELDRVTSGGNFV